MKRHTNIKQQKTTWKAQEPQLLFAQFELGPFEQLMEVLF